MSERDDQSSGSTLPSLSEQLRFFCERVGITVEGLESRLQLPRGALKHNSDARRDPGLAGVLRISFPELDWVPGSPTFPGPEWRPRIDPEGAPEDEPRTDTERRLLKIWRRTLKNDAVGADDRFADVGGSSLLATKILARIYDVFDVRIPSEIVASAHTVRELAVIVDRSQEADQTLILWTQPEAEADGADEPS